MRFRILKIWLLVTAVIASLSLVSCKKDCSDSAKGGSVSSDMPPGINRQFCFYLVEKGTGKPYLTHTGSNVLLKSIKDVHPVAVSIHEGGFGTTTAAYTKDVYATTTPYAVRSHKNYGVVFGPVGWEQSGWQAGGAQGFVIRLKEVVEWKPGSEPVLGRCDSTGLYLYPQPQIVDESDCKVLPWIEYYNRRMTSGGGETVRPYFYKGNGETDTIRVEI